MKLPVSVRLSVSLNFNVTSLDGCTENHEFSSKAIVKIGTDNEVEIDLHNTLVLQDQELIAKIDNMILDKIERTVDNEFPEGVQDNNASIESRIA